MLNLKWETPASWVTEVEPHIDEMLVDHAHCEKKAAGTAMQLIFIYSENVEFVKALAEIVTEELQHLTMVLDLLKARNIEFVAQKPSRYGARLGKLVRDTEPDKIVDKCLVAALIEARSCERFAILRDNLKDQELAEVFGSLFELEARHYTTYLKFAQFYAAEEIVMNRFDELAIEEAKIIQIGDPTHRVHG